MGTEQVEREVVLNLHDLDALAAGLRQLGWRDDLADARVEIIRERLQQRDEQIVGAEAQLARCREAAKRVKSQAAAPEYDEEAIRELLWHLVDVALAESDIPPACMDGEGGVCGECPECLGPTAPDTEGVADSDTQGERTND